MKKKLYFGSNLKMYKPIKETVEYLQSLVEHTKDISRDEIELFIIPSYTTLERAVNKVDRNYVKSGAQNMCWEDEGQFTGEISPVMLKELGLDLVMIGHSERRHVFGETDVEENKKVKAALNHGFTTLLCIGETAEEKNFGISAEVLRTQLKVGFHDVPVSQVPNIWVAYEPVWLSKSVCRRSSVMLLRTFRFCTVEVSIPAMPMNSLFSHLLTDYLPDVLHGRQTSLTS